MRAQLASQREVGVHGCRCPAGHLALVESELRGQRCVLVGDTLRLKHLRGLSTTLPQRLLAWCPTQLVWHLPLPLVLENLKAVEP